MLPLVVAILITISDQWTKILVRRHLDLYENIVLIDGFFDLRYIQNTGAAWGLFADGHYWLAGLSIVVLGMMVAWHQHFFRDCLIDRIAFGLLIGGIAGNMIDRIRLQYVVDFLDFYWGGTHFPAFNVADSAICIGVGLVMFVQFSLSYDEYRAQKLQKDG